jgi:hypothetical protein
MVHGKIREMNRGQNPHGTVLPFDTPQFRLHDDELRHPRHQGKGRHQHQQG